MNQTTVSSRLLSLVCVFLLIGAASAQIKKKQTDQIDAEEEAKLKAQSQLMSLPPLDAPVDPEKYIVGPSDIFAVAISYTPQMVFSLTVSLEGTLIVPTVGEVQIAGRTLGEAKKLVLVEVRKKYLTGTPTVTLLKPREIIVSVSGNVKYPGRFVLFATNRVEEAAQKANRPPNLMDAEILQKLPELIQWPANASKRNIMVKRRNGSQLRVDLPKYYSTRNDRWNPYLQEGDEVFVPTIDLSRNVVAVYGAVNQPGRYEFVEGDMLLDILDVAKGFAGNAVLDSVTLFRQDPMSLTLHNSFFSVYDIVSGKVSNVRLEPGDRVVVKEKLDMRQDYRVTVDGEVLYPGTYPIAREHTRLSEVLQKAGGPTRFASLKHAELIRRTVDSKEIDLERLLKNRGNILSEDEAYLNLENELRIQGERVRVNFEKLLIEKDSSQDVFLRPEDRIIIPSAEKSVYVFGQVLSPTQVPYASGKDVDYYVSKAGGFTDRAKTGDVMIIKRTTRQWVQPGDTEIEDGDYIWVPKVPDRPFSYYLGVISQTASIITGALTIILLVLQLQK